MLFEWYGPGILTFSLNQLLPPSLLLMITLIARVLPICWDAVGVFYSRSWLGHRTVIGRVLPLCRDAVSLFYSHRWLTYRTLIGKVLSLCRDAVGVFYSCSWWSLRTLIGRVLLSAEIQSVYSAAVADGDRGHSLEGSYPQQWSLCIF